MQNAESRRSGTDIVTTIYALSGLEALAEAEHAKTFDPGESVFDVVKELANRLAEESNGDVKVDPKNIVGIDGVVEKVDNPALDKKILNSLKSYSNGTYKPSRRK